MKKRVPVQTAIFAATFLLQLGALTFQSRGAAGDVDLSFDAGSSVTNPVSVVVVQPDGRVLIGGPLTFINGTNHYASARLKADGSWDSAFISDSFNPDWAHLGNGFANHFEVAAVAMQPDGKVLVGGVMARICAVGEEECQSIFESFVTRLNPNGSHDTNFTPFLGDWALAVEQMPRLQTVASQPDGKVLIGYDGYGVVRGIVRLNANGIRDTNFNPSVDYPGVYSIVPQPDGKVLMGGLFSTVNGTNRSGLARLNSNGSLDNTFNPPMGGYPLALQPDGKIIVGGFARLYADGSLDHSFNPGTGAYGIVRSIALQSDGKVLAGGAFTSLKGVARQYVARLHGDAFLPSLKHVRSNALVTISWPVTSLNFQLQQTTNLSLPNSWLPVSGSTVTNAGHISVSLPTVVGSGFFRLQSQ